MEARASARKLIISADKTRLIVDLIRGKQISDAMAILNNLNKRAARLTKKVLVSAVANAENNLKLNKEKLYVKEAYVNEGSIMKRIIMGSRGHVDRHDKRTSHITVIVAEKN